ncbi:hypothetical protein, partial [Rhodoferax sp. UBA5149]|uniref:hypothetical protein n=1 Tax=Rhodoferax sp. UBA5149 TaxID=1947379 RepID=UPI0025E5B63E
MNIQNSTPDNEIRQRYFLISKRWTVALILLVLVIYGCAVLWSEFVFSTSFTSDAILAQRAEQLKRLGCPQQTEIEKSGYVIASAQLPSSRKPWLFDKTY